MAERGKRWPVRLTATAQRELAAVMEWSAEQFGARAALRYDALITQALKDLSADPERPGSTERPELLIEGARTYHLTFSRARVAAGQRVQAPRHFVVYRCGADGVEVVRILHDRRSLEGELDE